MLKHMKKKPIMYISNQLNEIKSIYNCIILLWRIQNAFPYIYFILTRIFRSESLEFLNKHVCRVRQLRVKITRLRIHFYNTYTIMQNLKKTRIVCIPTQNYLPFNGETTNV